MKHREAQTDDGTATKRRAMTLVILFGLCAAVLVWTIEHPPRDLPADLEAEAERMQENMRRWVRSAAWVLVTLVAAALVVRFSA